MAQFESELFRKQVSEHLQKVEATPSLKPLSEKLSVLLDRFLTPPEDRNCIFFHKYVSGLSVAYTEFENALLKKLSDFVKADVSCDGARILFDAVTDLFNAERYGMMKSIKSKFLAPIPFEDIIYYVFLQKCAFLAQRTLCVLYVVLDIPYYMKGESLFLRENSYDVIEKQPHFHFAETVFVLRKKECQVERKLSKTFLKQDLKRPSLSKLDQKYINGLKSGLQFINEVIPFLANEDLPAPPLALKMVAGKFYQVLFINEEAKSYRNPLHLANDVLVFLICLLQRVKRTFQSSDYVELKRDMMRCIHVIVENLPLKPLLKIVSSETLDLFEDLLWQLEYIEKVSSVFIELQNCTNSLKSIVLSCQMMLGKEPSVFQKFSYVSFVVDLQDVRAEYLFRFISENKWGEKASKKRPHFLRSDQEPRFCIDCNCSEIAVLLECDHILCYKCLQKETCIKKVVKCSSCQTVITEAMEASLYLSSFRDLFPARGEN